MHRIVTEAGYLLSYGFEKLNSQKVLHPFLTLLYATGEQKRESFQDISYEISIPKVINRFHANDSNADAAIAIYPAEIEEKGVRKPLIIVMLKEYKSNRYLTIGQHYEVREGFSIPTLYELLDFSPSLTDELRELEQALRNGAENFVTAATNSL